MRQATVRFYLDADVLGLAKLLAKLRPDMTYPSDPGGIVHKQIRPPCPITNVATKDQVWIPECSRQGWLIITRDSRIQSHASEMDAVRTFKARMVALASTDAKTTWDQLEVFMPQWREIERCLQLDGPFIYSATRTTLRPIQL
jgi:hypothetical protein